MAFGTTEDRTSVQNGSGVIDWTRMSATTEGIILILDGM